MKFMILFAVIALMGSCSNGSSTPPPSVEDEQVSCSQCGGSGYCYGETCQNCLGLDIITTRTKEVQHLLLLVEDIDVEQEVVNVLFQEKN